MKQENIKDEEFLSFFARLSTKIKNNIEVVTPEDIEQNFLLHIDKETPKYFEPRIGQSFSGDEDRTVPRVTVSSNILGCIIGYYRFIKDFLEDFSKNNNGYYINIIPFEYALKPTAKLVPYGEHADEYWLVNYSKNTMKYIPETIDKIFIAEMKHVLNDKKGAHNISCTFYVEINTDKKIAFAKNKLLTEGYYKITGDMSEYNSDNSADGSININHDDLDLFTIRRIQIDEYKEAKKLSAALLSHKEPLIKYW